MLEQQVTKAELARRLKVKPQSVDYMLTRKSIDTDTLYNVSRALNYDFALLYSIHKEQINKANSRIYNKKEIRKGRNSSITIILPISIGKRPQFFTSFDFIIKKAN